MNKFFRGSLENGFTLLVQALPGRTSASVGVVVNTVPGTKARRKPA